ncbi:MAG: hypothetical protein KDK66_09085 [Deltaproteobacteria bacterium]|nr:hypothetical protein [Deltaproteobacteria bacterium]
MAYFSSKEELKKVLGGFFKELVKHPEIGPKLKKSGLKLQFAYTHPELSISVDLSQEDSPITFDDQAFKPDVKMSMKADIAHRFWFGNINLLAALAKKDIVAKGPIPKILKLLPAVKPAYKLYPEYLQKHGYDSFMI